MIFRGRISENDRRLRVFVLFYRLIRAIRKIPPEYGTLESRLNLEDECNKKL
jgi:hypothetical protein